MNQKILEAISEGVFEGEIRRVKEQVLSAIGIGLPVKQILEEGLIHGMDKVGVLFRDGEMFVPEVLVSSKAMQGGMELIRPLLLESGVKTLGKVLTVTVEGDLHDIGIKLVGMMMEGAGFEVVNMGVDASTAAIVEKIKEEKPNILGMSAMLTTTMVNMKKVVEKIKAEGLYDNLKIMVGGAPLSSEYAKGIGAYYSSNANEAVEVAKMIVVNK
ncbi:MAG: B12-binding domain-containing protein [Synergistales bacterium]